MWWSDLHILCERIQVMDPSITSQSWLFVCIVGTASSKFQIDNTVLLTIVTAASSAKPVQPVVCGTRRCFPTNHHICEGPTTGGFHKCCFPPHAKRGLPGRPCLPNTSKASDLGPASCFCKTPSDKYLELLGHAVSVAVTQFCRSNVKATMKHGMGELIAVHSKTFTEHLLSYSMTLFTAKM